MIDLTFIDGFDHYTSSQLKWTSPPSSYGTGRAGTGQSAEVGTSGSKLSLTGFIENGENNTFAFAYKNGSGTIGPFGIFWDLRIDWTNGNFTILRAVIEVNYHINFQVFNGAAGFTTPNIFGTGYYLKHNSWFHIEIIVAKFANNEIICSLYVNNQFIGTYTFRYATGSGLADYLSAEMNIYRGFFDDFITARSTTPVGDCYIQYIKPISDDTVSWTPFASANNYAEVDDTTPDSDTTYNSTDVVNNSDLFGMEALPTGYDIVGAQIISYAKKLDYGVAGLQHFMETAGAITSDIGNMHYLSLGQYMYFKNGFFINPDTGNAFTVSEFNSAKFGYKKGA